MALMTGLMTSSLSIPIVAFCCKILQIPLANLSATSVLFQLLFLSCVQFFPPIRVPEVRGDQEAQLENLEPR